MPELSKKSNLKMKCLTSFLLIVLCVNVINCVPYTDQDYIDAVKDVKYLFGEGSGQVDAEVSSSTTIRELITRLGSLDGIITVEGPDSNDDLIPITTPTPEDLSIYTKEDLQKKIATRFNDLRDEFSKSKQEILDKSKSSRDEHEISSFTFINLFQNKYDKEVTQMNENIKRLESKRTELENAIKGIQEYSMNDVENAEKLRKFKESKKVLQNFKDQGCDECHGFLDDNTVDDELKIIDKEIAKHENNAEHDGDRKQYFDSKQTQIINTKYLELIHIYEKEVEERKRKENFELINKMIQEKLMNHTEFIENNLDEELKSMQNLAENLLVIQKLKSSDQSDTEEDTESCSFKPYEWRAFKDKSDTKLNGVLAGIDLDGSELYVIRKKQSDLYLYGKLALRSSRNDAYVTTESSEVAIDNFEVSKFNIRTKNIIFF